MIYRLHITGTYYPLIGSPETFAATLEATDRADQRRRYRNIRRQIAYNRRRKRLRLPFQIIEYVEKEES